MQDIYVGHVCRTRMWDMYVGHVCRTRMEKGSLNQNHHQIVYRNLFIFKSSVRVLALTLAWPGGDFVECGLNFYWESSVESPVAAYLRYTSESWSISSPPYSSFANPSNPGSKSDLPATSPAVCGVIWQKFFRSSSIQSEIPLALPFMR
jgi:hypothetical protein